MLAVVLRRRCIDKGVCDSSYLKRVTLLTINGRERVGGTGIGRWRQRIEWIGALKGEFREFGGVIGALVADGSGDGGRGGK